MKPTKTLGLDRYIVGFFSKNLGSYKIECHGIEQWFLWEEGVNKAHKYYFLLLIPKVKDVVNILDYKPISCLNTIYKLLSKILARRLSTVLPELISINQTTFVRGHLISDNISLAEEQLRLEVTKEVDWNTIQITLRSTGFSRAFTRMIKKCVTTLSFSLLVEGEATKQFTSGHGLWQGDPLSSWIFTMVLQNFSQELHLAVTNKEYDTYIMSGARSVTFFVCRRHSVVCKSEYEINEDYQTNDRLILGFFRSLCE